MSDEIDIRIKEENQVFINDVLLEDGNTLSGADAGGTTEYGGLACDKAGRCHSIFCL